MEMLIGFILGIIFTVLMLTAFDGIRIDVYTMRVFKGDDDDQRPA